MPPFLKIQICELAWGAYTTCVRGLWHSLLVPSRRAVATTTAPCGQTKRHVTFTRVCFPSLLAVGAAMPILNPAGAAALLPVAAPHSHNVRHDQPGYKGLFLGLLVALCRGHLPPLARLHRAAAAVVVDRLYQLVCCCCAACPTAAGCASSACCRQQCSPQQEDHLLGAHAAAPSCHSLTAALLRPHRHLQVRRPCVMHQARAVGCARLAS